MGLAAFAGVLFFVVAIGAVVLIIYRVVDPVVQRHEQKSLSKIAPKGATKEVSMVNGKVVGMGCPYCRKVDKIRIAHWTSLCNFMDKNKIFIFKGVYFYAQCNSCKKYIGMEKIFNYLDSKYFQVYVYTVWSKNTETLNAAEEWVPDTVYPTHLITKKVVKGLRRAFEVSNGNYEVFDEKRFFTRGGRLDHIETTISTYGAKINKTFLKFEDKDLSRIRLK